MFTTTSMNDLQQKQGKDTRFDRIKKHLKNPDRYPLHQKDKEKLDRWDFIVDCIRNYDTESEVRDKLMHQHGVARSTAYRDIMEAKHFYGSTTKEEKNFWRQALVEMQTQVIRKAVAQENWQEANRGIKNMAMMLNLDKEDVELPNWEELTNNNYVLVVNTQNNEYTINLTDAENVPEEKKKTILNAMPSETSEIEGYLGDEGSTT